MNGRWPKVILMSGVTTAILIYEIGTASGAPGQALALLQYGLLGCALFSLVGALVMMALGE